MWQPATTLNQQATPYKHEKQWTTTSNSNRQHQQATINNEKEQSTTPINDKEGQAKTLRKSTSWSYSLQWVETNHRIRGSFMKPNTGNFDGLINMRHSTVVMYEREGRN